MAILQSIRTRLLSQTAVTDIVGTRIHPQWRPQDGALAAITLQRISEDHVHNLEGGAGLARPRIQVDCWSSKYSEAQSLGEAVREALQGFTGTVDSVTIHSCLLDNRADLFEPPKDGSDKGIYHIALDFQLIYGESIPS